MAMEEKPKMKFNEEQLTAIESKKPIVLIAAGAGSGKTRVLTERFLYLCNKKLAEIIHGEKATIGAEVSEIVAITFTEKAAREMKKRIRERIVEELLEVEALEDKAKKNRARLFWKEQREALDSGFITTFHSFCHKLLHQFALKANLSPNFSVIDDVQSKLIKNQVFNEVFNNKDNHNRWKPLFNYYSKKQLKDSVLRVYEQVQENPSYDVVEYLEGFKPRENIINQLEEIRDIKNNLLNEFFETAKECVADFPCESTVKGKLKEKIPLIASYVENFKLDQMEPDQYFVEMKGIFKFHHTWEKNAPSLHELCKEHFGDLKNKWEQYMSFPKEKLGDFCIIIELFLDLLLKFQKGYQLRKDERAALDFADLQKKAIGLLKDDVEVALWCQREFKHFMIDEFQDTNGLQMGMLKHIDPQNRFIVGDGKQSIYRFRGADVTLMNNLEEQLLEENNCELINMGKNYRNCDSIIQFVNHLFSELLIKNEQSMEYGIEYKPLISNRTSELETHPNKKAELIVLEVEDMDYDREADEFDTEFDMLTERILEVVNQGKKIVKEAKKWRKPLWKDFAILLPARTGLGELEKKLNDKNIPYIVHGGVGFFEKQEIKDMLNLLRFISRPWEPVYVLALLRGPLFQMSMNDFFTIKERIPKEDNFATYILGKGFNNDENLNENLKEKLQKFYNLFLRFVPLTTQKDFIDTLTDIFENSGLKTSILVQKNPLQKVKNVEKLIEIMADQSVYSLEELLEQVDILSQLSDREGEADAEIPEGNMVNIMTVHASKGLEFPIVCLPKLNRSLRKDGGDFIYDEKDWLVAKFKEESEADPFKVVEYFTPTYKTVKAKADMAALEESKRLFYVATTRARDYLIMTAQVKVNKEKEKVMDNSWLSMLNCAQEANLNLQEYLTIKKHTDITKQGAAAMELESFAAKTDIPNQEVPYTFSVSEIMLFINDPEKYYDDYIIKINPQWFKSHHRVHYNEKIIAGTEFGTLVHRACELYDQGFSQEEAAQDALNNFEDEVIDLSTMKDEILNLLDKYNEIKDLEIGEHVYSEWNFVTEIAGAYVIGEIDKVFKVGDGYHLMDLKTNIITSLDSQVESYTPQVYLYKMAYEKEEKAVVDKVSLFFMRQGKKGFKTLPVDNNYEDKIKQVIKEMIRLRRKNANRTEYQQAQNNTTSVT